MEPKNPFYAPGKDWIQTQSGRKFWPLNPNPDDIRLADIAHALGMTTRFTGHLDRFYSVAEHSVKVALITKHLGGNDEDYKQALLHDASEAYLCDIASPVKQSPEFAGYRAAEDRLQRTIYRKYGVEEDMRPIVKQADLVLLKTEAEHMFSLLQPEWNEHLSKIEVPKNVPLSFGLKCYEATYELKEKFALYWGTTC